MKFDGDQTIPDQATQTFVRFLPNAGSRTHDSVEIGRLCWWRTHGSIFFQSVSLKWCHLSSRSSALLRALVKPAVSGGCKSNVVGIYHQDSRVIHLLTVLQEEKILADVQNNTMYLICADVSYFVTMTDLRSIIVDCSYELFSLNLIANL